MAIKLRLTKYPCGTMRVNGLKVVYWVADKKKPDIKVAVFEKKMNLTHRLV